MKNFLFFPGNSRWLQGLVPQALGLLRSWLSALTREQVKLPRCIFICFLLLFGEWFIPNGLFHSTCKVSNFLLWKVQCHLMYTKANTIIMASVVWLTNKWVLWVNLKKKKKKITYWICQWLLNQHQYTQVNQNWNKSSQNSTQT